MDVKTTIPIGGMSCAACAANVQRAITALPGVKYASVNIATENAAISYDPQKVRMPEIRDAIKNSGYQPLDEVKAGVADDNKKRKQKEIKTLKAKFLVAAAFAVPLLYIAMAPMITFAKLPLPRWLDMMDAPVAFALVQLMLVVPIIVVGHRFYIVGFRALARRSPNMDSLIAVGTSAALLYSMFNTLTILTGDHGAVHVAVESLYYETAGVIITLILLGKTLEAVSRGRTGEAIKKLMGLAPKTAIIVQNGAEKEIPISEVEVGDIILVKPGAIIPVDGTVIDGYTAIDESMLTGESMPVDKKAGDPVYAATINAMLNDYGKTGRTEEPATGSIASESPSGYFAGSILYRADRIGADTALAQIIKLVEEAQNSKAPIAALADKVSGIFVPVVCAAAFFAGIAWLIGTGGDLRFALTVFISILVIACPCALGLATPTAIIVGVGKGAAKGILIRSGQALEAAYRTETIVLDKTGTITEGKPVVTAVEGDVIQLAASLERYSEHPVARAVCAHYDGELLDVRDFKAIVGQGVEGFIEGKKIEIRRVYGYMSTTSIKAGSWFPTNPKQAAPPLWKGLMLWGSKLL